ncbi:MAG: Asp-tRNA(Asn)/Glu-tRNA(Gln) amidotransferase subunit GatC [bacterium]|nr:Asp-tRNA(Asn)/Glu-tRNA(Gln) amidotransferase subunit GatC [bacterium]MCP5039479.1 Asp-tRNA(Asn)/Glu-tRNA(Gln) amidotransferase subunit GatC [bacterium]
MSRISAEQVQYIADLARLSFTPDGVEKMAGEMDRILEWVETLAELDTRDIIPTAHAIALGTPVREDQAAAAMDPEAAVANAPQRVGTAFSVPKVLEGDDS